MAARTYDSRVFLGSEDGGNFTALDDAYEWSVAGATTVTQQATLGQAAEDQSVHAAGLSSTVGMYEGSASRSARDAASEEDLVLVIADAQGGPGVAIPVIVPSRSRENPQTDAITAPMSFGQRAAAEWCAEVATVEDQDNQPATTLPVQVSSGTVIYVVVTEKSTGAITVTIDASGQTDIDTTVSSTGIYRVEIPSSWPAAPRDAQVKDGQRQPILLGPRPCRYSAGAARWVSSRTYSQCTASPSPKVNCQGRRYAVFPYCHRSK